MKNTNYNNDRILYPLTHPQKRIWYIEKIYPGTSLYNIGGTVRIKGTIDFSILEEAINALIKNNEGLRLRFVEENTKVEQYVSCYEKIKLDLIDFTKLENPEKEFTKWVKKEAKKPFLMEDERLFYFALFRISDYDNGYLVKFHHIISDGWAVNIMTEHISDAYMKLFNGKEILDSMNDSYIEYISNEERYLLSDRFLKNKSFWDEKFKILPNAFLNKSSDTIEGKRKTFELDSEISSKIKGFVTDNKYSLNTLFIMLYLLYLYKTTQQEDIVIGIPVYNRSGKKEKSMVGMFTSTMPFRFTVDDNLNVMDTMVKINKQLKECYFNQKYPYDLLVQDLELKKKGYDNLFNICVNYYNTKHKSELNGSPIENVEFYNGKQIYSLQLIIKDWSDSGNLSLDFDYKINDYSDEQIDDMYVRLLNLTNKIIMNPFEKIRNISLLFSGERKKLLYDFNATDTEYPKDKVIYQLFEDQMKKTPEKVAICFNNIELTYRKLNERANQLARYLVKKNVGKETIVGLLTTHSIETVVGILGILKAGGIYLPFDYNSPTDRISYMLKDSNSNLLLTNIELSKDIDFDCEIINLNNPELYLGDTSNLECVNNPSDLVYVIYTSGSTGKPKGTMIEHQSLVNYVWWAKKMYIKNETEVFPLYSSLAFDLTVTSIFTPLISGSIIAVYDDNNKEEYVLFRIMKDNKATVIKLTPSHLSLLKDMNNSNSSVRRFIVGGEDLKVNIAKNIHQSFNGKVEIYNEYGPTETVVGCMIHKYECEKDKRISVPIGIPADNVQIYILDKNLKPVPANSVGEMHISGNGVARGYLNSPMQTLEKFVDNPFENGKRMYKSGDLVRFLNNGRIEYVGRADEQVKIRGYRIELGEIEKYLISHEAVKDSVVIDLEEKNGGKYLCAYIVKKVQVSMHELKIFLLKYLPDYMIPLYFIELEEVPLTRNGKLNRELLPKPLEAHNENIDFTKYRNEKEKNLTNTICDVLHLERVSVRQNFYHLGGDSIKAIQIASKLNDKGFKINVKDILSNPIIEDMALCIRQSKGLAINQKHCEGSIRPTSIVSWFFSQNFINPNYYNQSVLLELKQDIETKKLEIILNELIKHYDSLRINYNSLTGELFYNNEHLDRCYNIKEYDLTNLSYSMQVDKMIFFANELKSNFNIENDVLIKACIFNLGNEKKMLISAHHLVIDGVSWRIILEDINTMIKQINNGEVIVLSSKTHSYQEWAKVMENYYMHEMNDEKSYWKQILGKNFHFPIEHNLGEDTVDSSSTISAHMNEELTECLLSKANMPYNTETKDLLVMSLLRTLKDLTGSEDIVIELEGHGRDNVAESIDISRTIGWFTSIYPFYSKLIKDDLTTQIKEVKEEIRKIPNNGIGFGALKYLLKDFGDNKNKYIRFNFLGDFSAEDKNNPVSLLKDQIGSDYDQRNQLTYIIEFNCFIVGGELNVLLTYSKNKFSEMTMKRYLDSFMNNLTTIIDHCCQKESVEFTPSDFDTLDITAEELDSLFI